MRALAVALLLALAARAFAQDEAVAPVTPQSAAIETGSLSLRFQGVKGGQGVVIAALFDNRAAYDADKGPVRIFRLPASEGNFSVTVAGLPPGRYGLKAFHDRDDSGRITLGAFGIPTEPYAFSNNVRVLGVTPWRHAAFTVAPGPNSQVLRLR